MNNQVDLELLRAEITALLQGDDTKSRSEAIKWHMYMYSVCDVKGEEAYTMAHSTMNEFVNEFEKGITSAETYITSWNLFLDRAKALDEKLKRLNDTYIDKMISDSNVSACLEDDKVFTILNLMKKLWSQLFQKLKSKVTGFILEDLQNQRNSASIQSKIYAKLIIESIAECEEYRRFSKVYEDDLEKPIKEGTEKYYRKLSNELLQSEPIGEYFCRCYNLLEKELEIAKNCFPASESLIHETAWRCLFLNQTKGIAAEVQYLFSNEKHQHLKIAYNLLNNSPETLDIFCNEMELHETKTLLKLREDTKDSEFCETFLRKFEEKINLIDSRYGSNKQVREALDKAVHNALNVKLKKENRGTNDLNTKAGTFTSHMPNIVASYCDYFLKKGMQGLEDATWERNLDNVVIILNYVDDKDIFYRMCVKNLAKRLIHSLSQSIDAEELMIKKIKECVGTDYTRKLEKMIGDYRISKDTTMKFKESLENQLPFSFNIMVLPSGAWPIGASKSNLLVPQQLEKGMQSFVSFYKDRQNGRKLLWNHDLSTCEVRLNYLSKSYTMQVSVTTLTVLTNINASDSITMADLENATGLDEEELSKYLRFLVKEKIVLCEDGDIVKTSIIKLNYKYENKRQKFKLVPQFQDKNREEEQTLKSVEDNRKFYLQAVIVKIMKANKTMTHDDLLKEVVKLTSSTFVPSHSIIKSTIGFLIDKEYMEKKGEAYHYLA